MWEHDLPFAAAAAAVGGGFWLGFEGFVKG
jgi:hypothetical protein